MALKDKLMTLEDFKAVRDVDVASNSAQFTEIKADLQDTISNTTRAITEDVCFSIGRIVPSTGNIKSDDTTALKRFITNYFLNGNERIVVTGGFSYSVFAYDKSTLEYIGWWDGTGFVKTSYIVTYTGSFWLSELGDYAYKIMFHSPSTNNISTSDFSNANIVKNIKSSNLEDYILTGAAEIELQKQTLFGSYIKSDGTIGIDSRPDSMLSISVSVKAGKRYKIITTGANRLRYGLYSSITVDAKPIEWYDKNDDITDTYINVPTDCYLVVYYSYQVPNTSSCRVSFVGDVPEEQKHLNILIYGNSYATDAWGYVPFILKKYGITVNIYLYYRGSGSIKRLVAEWDDDTADGQDIYGSNHVRRLCHIDTRVSSLWDSVSSDLHPSPHQVLKYVDDPTKGVDKWDIITLQGVASEQYSDGNGGYTRAPGLEPYFRQAINLIYSTYTEDSENLIDRKPFQLGLFGTYTRIQGNHVIPSSAMDNRIEVLKSDEAVYKTEPFNFVLPVGAAVFSARTNPDLASTVISDIGNLWANDYIHLQEGVPCYIAALTVCQAIFNRFYPQYSVLNDDTRLTQNMVANEWNVPMRNGTVKTFGEGVDGELYYQLAQKCAVAANNFPFDITPIYSPTDNTAIVYDRAKYAADGLIDTSGIVLSS